MSDFNTTMPVWKDRILPIDSAEKVHDVRLRISTPEEILSWSNGEIKLSETLNYKTFKPVDGGLFCERIFGTSKDYKCSACGKKHRRTDEGKWCMSCGETLITSSFVRRRRMGHINLATPIAHYWFVKNNYSTIAKILGITSAQLDDLVYFRSHIVVATGGLTTLVEKEQLTVQKAPKVYYEVLKELREKFINDADKVKELDEEIEELAQFSADLGQKYGISFYDYNALIVEFSPETVIATGSEAVVSMLKQVDIKSLAVELKERIADPDVGSIKQKLIKRLEVVDKFAKSGQKLENMVITVLPVIPPEMRPLIQLDGGRHSSTDVNDLYRRVIIRNNRLQNWIDMEAPDLIVQNEKRMLQEAVDALIDNSKKANPITSKDGRPLKSLSENLKGKQGRFRQNLIGKRVDYSGRSVITVGPELKMNQVGLPKKMVAKLFEPEIIHMMIEDEVTSNIRQAKKLIEAMDDVIWPYVQTIIIGRTVLLNRAPTLHKLSIQSFEIVIVSGKSILLPALVTTGFNADFDGDQMAVHLTLSDRAQEEAKRLMSPVHNILGPKDGEPIVTPSQDIILGLYYMTISDKEAKGAGMIVKSMEEAKLVQANRLVHLHAPIIISTKMFPLKFKTKKGYVATTLGRLLFNDALPVDLPYQNDLCLENFKKLAPKYHIEAGVDAREVISNLDFDVPFGKKGVSALVKYIHQEYTNEETAEMLDDIKDLGFKYSTYSGASVSIGDIIQLENKNEYVKKGDIKISELHDFYMSGLITDDERYTKVVNIWSEIKEEIQDQLVGSLSEFQKNPIFMMMDSGARGNISNFVQLAGMRGLMSKPTTVYAAAKIHGVVTRTTEEIPVKSSFREGLSGFEFFLSTLGARKGLSDTATKTAKSGYLTRKLVDAAQNIYIKEEDCKAASGFMVRAIKDTKTGSIIEPLAERINGRFIFKTVKHPKTEEVMAKKGELVSPEVAVAIEKAGVGDVWIRSVLTCDTRQGACAKCFGLDLSTKREVSVGEAVGVIAAQSIGEPGTQLTMRTFHTGGVAGVADITQGFDRLLELVDAINVKTKGAATISGIKGKVEAIETKSFEKDGKIMLEFTIKNSKEKEMYLAPINSSVRVSVGDDVIAGAKLTDGPVELPELLRIAGVEALQVYLIKEIQKLYRIQGIDINDKYMEIIISKMLSKVKVSEPGSTSFTFGEVVDIDAMELENDKYPVTKQAKFTRLVVGVKTTPTLSRSFLASASYQETSKALMNAALEAKIDPLVGVKENAMMGKIIPSGTGMLESGEKYDIFTEIDAKEEAEIAEKKERFMARFMTVEEDEA